VHELALAQEIVDIARRRAGASRVRRVTVRVGVLAAVVPEALRFCFDLACEDTPLSGAALDIVELPARGRCRSCAAESLFDGPWAVCGCGAAEVDWLSGDELVVQSMEVT
jgi:hydrogenase nickel incorporation protein HypA/HybF